jgi:hypothetical protein
MDLWGGMGLKAATRGHDPIRVKLSSKLLLLIEFFMNSLCLQA